MGCIPKQNIFFQRPKVYSKLSRGSLAEIPSPDLDYRSKWVPETRKQKDAHGRTMQNPGLRFANGAIILCCKLGPKTILGPQIQQLSLVSPYWGRSESICALRVSFWKLWGAFGVPFWSLWSPFGSLLDPFWAPWGPLGAHNMAPVGS